MTLCNGLDCHFKGHDIVSRHQAFGIFQIDLMLGRRDLMVRSLHLNIHILQIQDNVPAHIFSQIDRTYIKVAGIFVGIGGRSSFLIGME